MDSDFIEPFIQSTKNTFDTMAGIKVTHGEPIKDREYKLQGDISGVVGFAESNIFGSASLCFPKETAFYVYQRMIGESVDEINAEVLDIIGELANIIVGGAKVLLGKIGITYHISIPSVVEGVDHVIRYRADTQYIIIPFSITGNLQFSIVISKKI